MSLDEMILDDDGLIRLLKFPQDANMREYRDRRGLPYRKFKVGGRTLYRYVTSEVLAWFVAGQHKDDQRTRRGRA